MPQKETQILVSGHQISRYPLSVIVLNALIKPTLPTKQI